MSEKFSSPSGGTHNCTRTNHVVGVFLCAINMSRYNAMILESVVVTDVSKMGSMSLSAC